MNIGKKNKNDNKTKKISIDIEEKALELIDMASKQEFRSRTSFLVSSSVDKAKEILKK